MSARTRPGGAAPDADRAAVYAAERSAFDGTDLEVPLGLDRAIGLARTVVDGPRWPGPPTDVRAARADAASSSCRATRPTAASPLVEIRLARPQTTIATVAHELAHALVGVDQGHDEQFRRAYLDLVLVVTNLDSADRRLRLHVDQLAEAFRAEGLAIGRRAWPDPAASIGGPIAL